jgi:hypothetical protein
MWNVLLPDEIRIFLCVYARYFVDAGWSTTDIKLTVTETSASGTLLTVYVPEVDCALLPQEEPVS